MAVQLQQGDDLYTFDTVQELIEFSRMGKKPTEPKAFEYGSDSERCARFWHQLERYGQRIMHVLACAGTPDVPSSHVIKTLDLVPGDVPRMWAHIRTVADRCGLGREKIVERQRRHRKPSIYTISPLVGDWIKTHVSSDLPPEEDP